MPRYIDSEKIKIVDVLVKIDKSRDLFVSWRDMLNAIMQTPTADVQEVRHGNWEQQPRPYDDEIICTACGANFNIIENCTENFNYCPNCGAKMDGKDG